MYMLLDGGFEIKVVGHSLGAGVAAILVADLKNGLFRRQQLRTANPDGISPEEEEKLLSDSKFIYLGLDYDNVHVQACNISEEELTPLPSVKAICYATPPCVGETLANAFLKDELILSMVNGNDIVPRLSGRNIQNLAEEIQSFSSTAEFWMKEDEARLKRYATTVGKEGKMKSSTHPNVTTESEPTVENMDRAGELATVADIESTCNVLTASSSKDESTFSPFPLRQKAFSRDDFEPDLPVVDRTRMTSGISTPDIMVVPGKIAHFTKPRGIYRVTLCDYRIVSLSKISLLRDSIDEHYVKSHIEALRNYKVATNAVRRTEPPKWQKSYDDESKQWAQCSVCHSDPTWPFITNSDATRALVYHNCRACGKIVCVMCAPAGDSVPDSGIGEYQTLADHRIPIPSLGILSPERVCMPCYLHCYDH